MKHTWYRLIAVCLCLAILLSFTACRLSSTQPTGNTDPVDTSTILSPDVSPSALFSGSSYGAAVGSLIHNQISGLGQSIDNPLQALTPDWFHHAQIDATLDLALQFNSFSSLLNTLLNGTTFSLQFKTIEDTWRLNLRSEFREMADSDFSLEGLYDGSDVYLSMPGYLDTALQLPFDSFSGASSDIDSEPDVSQAYASSDLLSHLLSQLSDDEMQQLMDGLFAMLGELVSNTLSAIPNDACSLTNTTFEIGGSAIPVQQLSVSFTPEIWYAMAQAALTSLQSSQSATAFFQALTDLMTKFDEFATSFDEFQEELQDSLNNLSPDDFSGIANSQLTITGANDTIYAAFITLSDDETSLSIHLQDTRTVADGSLDWDVRFTTGQGTNALSCSGSLNTGVSTTVQLDFEMTVEQQEVLSLHFDAKSQDADFTLSLSLKANDQTISCTFGIVSDARQTRISLDNIFIDSDMISINDGQVTLTVSVSDNPDALPYTAPGDSISLEEFVNDENLSSTFLTNVFSNPVLLELLSSILP